MAFTPVRLENKSGDETVIVTTATDYNNLMFNAGYRVADDQDGLEEALKGGLDNGNPIEDADGDSEPVESETDAVDAPVEPKTEEPTPAKADAKTTGAKTSGSKPRSGATATDVSGNDVGVAGTGTTTA